MTDVWCFRPGWGTPGDKERNQHQHSGRPPQTGRRLELDFQVLLFFSTICLHSLVFSLLSSTSLQCALPELCGNGMSDGTRGSFQGNQVYPFSEPTSSGDGGPLQSVCTGNHTDRQQEKVQLFTTVAATVSQHVS